MHSYCLLGIGIHAQQRLLITWVFCEDCKLSLNYKLFKSVYTGFTCLIYPGEKKYDTLGLVNLTVLFVREVSTGLELRSSDVHGLPRSRALELAHYQSVSDVMFTIGQM